MQTNSAVLIILLLRATNSQSFCFEPQQIIDITTKYVLTIRVFDDQVPISTSQVAIAVLATFDGMLALVGIDGDLTWVKDTIDVLINQKGLKLYNYIRRQIKSLDQYFYTTFLPSLRDAIGPCVNDVHIVAAIDQHVQTITKTDQIVLNGIAELISSANNFFQLTASVILDINRRAIEQVHSGNYDLSAFDAETKALRAFLGVKCAEITKEQDDRYEQVLQSLFREIMQISIVIQQRCIALLRIH